MRTWRTLICLLAILASWRGASPQPAVTDPLPGADGPRVELVGTPPRGMHILDVFLYATPEQAAAGAARPNRFISGLRRLTLDIRVEELSRLGTTIRFEVLSNRGVVEMADGLFSYAELASEQGSSLQLDLVPRRPPLADGPYQLRLYMDETLVAVLNWSVGPDPNAVRGAEAPGSLGATKSSLRWIAVAGRMKPYSYVPFPATREHREGTGDPRPSIAERYPSREDFLTQIEAAGPALISQRYLLEEDLSPILERAAQHWDLLMGAR